MCAVSKYEYCAYHRNFRIDRFINMKEEDERMKVIQWHLKAPPPSLFVPTTLEDAMDKSSFI